MLFDELFTEAMKFSDIPPALRRKLNLRDIEAERPQSIYRYQVGDKQFMNLAAAQEFAQGTGEPVKTIRPDLEEVSLGQIGSKIGRGLGTVGKTLGAAAAIPQGMGRAIKKGYRSGLQTIGGDAGTTAAPATGQNEIPTQTGAINPATGRAYVPSDFATTAPTASTSIQPPARTASAAAAPQTTATAKASRIGAPAGKAALDTAVKTVDTVRSDRRQGVIDYGQDLLAAAEKKLAKMRRIAPAAQPQAPAVQPTQTFQPKTPAPAWTRGEPITVGKQRIKPSDPNYAKIAKAMAVKEDLAWSSEFDPSVSILNKIQKQP